MVAGSVERPTRRQRAIAKTMQLSWQNPQFAVEMGLDVSHWLAASASRQPGPGLVDHVIAAMARAARRHPVVNSSQIGEEIHKHAHVNVAVAIDVDDEILTPTVMDAGSLGLDGIHRERRRLTDAARSGRLTPEELFSGTISLSNLGPLGVTRFTSLVVPPQVCSLAMGAPDAHGRIAMTLSSDHRVVNGAPAARYLADVIAEASRTLSAASQNAEVMS